MTAGVLVKCIVGLFVGGSLAWLVLDREHRELREEGTGRRYVPYVDGLLLPELLLGLLVLSSVYYGPARAAVLTLSAFFGIFLHIAVYDLILLLLLPLLRRRFSARSCATLWMLPNFLYVLIQTHVSMPRPRLILRLPGRLGAVLLWVWAAGFVGVLLWKIIGHFRFRARVLRDAELVMDPLVRRVWSDEVTLARVGKRQPTLLYSSAVTTPLSIGMSSRSIRVVLPRRDYTEEELHLLLRHELVHIGRGDAASKFFLAFCTALCWFDPLIWVAMRKSADDLELSCDETVLLEAGEETRRQYAELLLTTAGDERGFTTCLSASAGALRYRLKSVMAPPKKRCGALLVGLACFLLFLSYGYVALAYGIVRGEEALFRGAPETCQLVNAALARGDSHDLDYICPDERALIDYLSGLELCRLTGNYDFNDDGSRYIFNFDAPEGFLWLDVCPDAVEVTTLHHGRMQSWTVTERYYLPDGADMDYLHSLLPSDDVLPAQ